MWAIACIFCLASAHLPRASVWLVCVINYCFEMNFESSHKVIDQQKKHSKFNSWKSIYLKSMRCHHVFWESQRRDTRYVFRSFFPPLLQLRMAASANFLECRHCLVRHSCLHDKSWAERRAWDAETICKVTQLDCHELRQWNIWTHFKTRLNCAFPTKLFSQVSMKTTQRATVLWFYFREPTSTLPEATSCLPVLKVIQISEEVPFLRVCPEKGFR